MISAPPFLTINIRIYSTTPSLIRFATKAARPLSPDVTRSTCDPRLLARSFGTKRPRSKSESASERQCARKSESSLTEVSKKIGKRLIRLRPEPIKVQHVSGKAKEQKTNIRFGVLLVDVD